MRTLGKGVSRVESRADGKRKSRPKQPLSFRGAKRRGNPFSLKQQCFLHGVKETRIATASLRTGLAMTVVFYTLPFLFPIGTSPPRRPLSRLRRASVSLRLGHGAALTCPRHVIHYRAAASLPKRGAKGCGKAPQVLFNLTRIIYHKPTPLSSGITELSQNFLDKVAV